MRKFLTIPTLLLALAALPTMAMPSLVAQADVVQGNYELVEQVHIAGDIRDSLYRLVDSGLADKESDVYVIEDIAENTLDDTLMIVVSLYNHQPSDISKLLGDEQYQL